MADSPFLSLSLSDELESRQLQQICHALSSPERIRILQFLQKQLSSLSGIANGTGIPFSSVVRHMDVLAEAKLVKVQHQPTPKGHVKYCYLNLTRFQVMLENQDAALIEDNEFRMEMPIGMFSQCSISPPCGMLSKSGPIGECDDPRALYLPERSNAECLWFAHGFVTYNFPLTFSANQAGSELSFSLELCSEAPYFNNNWLSDITFSVNGKELLTYTSPGDFGGKRGKYTPTFWPTTSTQYGILKTLSIDKTGVFLDGVLANTAITIDELNLFSRNYVELTIAVKKDAIHCGGINLFGANFGNYPQHIIMVIR